MRSRSAVGNCATLRPRRLERCRLRPRIGDAVAQMADKQHVEIGEIVFLDDEIVLGGEERRAVEAGRLQQRSGLGALGGRKHAAIGRHEAALEPFADGQRVVRHADGAIDIGRRVHFVGPGQAALPAFVDQLLGRRGERIRHRIPDIGVAGAVEIDGVFQIIRRQKLREPHGAGPGAFHVGELDLAALSRIFSASEKFLAELFLALAEIGLRRQHADRVVRVGGAAVIGFAAEDREQDAPAARRIAARSRSSGARYCASSLRPCTASCSIAGSLR